MCSIERRPACTARAMSATVASRCRSTNWVVPPVPEVSGTRHSTSGAPDVPDSDATGRGPPPPARAGEGEAVEAPPRDEAPGGRVVAEPAGGLAEQVPGGFPPAADQEQI